MTARKLILLVAAVMAFTTAQSFAADEAKPAKRLPVTMATTVQKAKFVTNLVTKSVAMRTIEKSGDAEALAVLEAARALIADAKSDLANNDAESADVKINKVVRMITKTTRRLSLAEVSGERAAKSYDNRLESITAIIGAYDRVLTEKGVVGDPKSRKRVSGYIDKAQNKRASGDIKGAAVSLGKAYNLATKLTRNLREGDTLVRELNFKTPKDEFLYEIDRNDSHVYLLEMTIKEKKPSAKFKDKINELRGKSEEFRDQAETLAGNGDHKGAIDLMSESTKQLIKAIRMGGNFIPG